MMVTTRFNEETYEQNRRYRSKYKEIGCIYGPSRRMSQRISPRAIVYVVEMNNTLNRIEGIGLIRNMLSMEKNYHIYKEGNYNRYIYKGSYRLDRSDMDPNILEIFDTILFKGKTHLKRGLGFTRIPNSLFQHEILERKEWNMRPREEDTGDPTDSLCLLRPLFYEEQIKVYIRDCFKEKYGATLQSETVDAQS
jgi:hypothetical protein